MEKSYLEQCKEISTYKEAKSLLDDMIEACERGRHIIEHFQSSENLDCKISDDNTLAVFYYKGGVLSIINSPYL